MVLLGQLISVFMFTFISISFYKKFAENLGLLDVPNERSVHNKITPRGAGIAFVLSVFLVVILFDFQHFIKYYYVYLAIAIVFAAGVWDDMKDISPKVKFIFIFFSVLILYMNDFALYSLGSYFGYEIVLPVWLVLPFTYLALAGFTNALNLMD
ncbi:MAG TPA: undecaprenyl/decaprenyl-phosphate alpha-N-acetylglucosaminyl 1-phosphate transferase, partial [Arcobacter sp.]|nr:undecaprenyl/decaprenyl-phosphate alpha-N-acetylglucosaminyl 1-phosphate transferase [Arcobacter sp.]